MSKLFKKLASDTAILAIGTIGSKLLVFLLMPLYTAYLSTAEYGTAELITTTANLLIPLACVGITNGIFRFAAERNADQEAVFTSSMLLLAGGSAVFLALSPLFFLVPFFGAYSWLIPLYVILANLQGVCAQYVRATDHTRLFAFQGIFNTLLTVLFNVLFLVVFHMGVTGYVLSVILGNLLTSALLFFGAGLYRVFRLDKVDRGLVRELLRFSLPMVPTTVCWLITDLSDRYLVTYYCGEAINGIYSAAYKIPSIVNLLSSVFMMAWQFSAVTQSSDEDGCREFYNKIYGGFLSLMVVGAAGLILFSDVLTGMLFNVAYAGASFYMPTLLAAAAVESIVAFLATVYLVKKKTMHSFVTAISGAILNVALNVVLIPSLGAIGAALATLASYLLVFGLRIVDAPRMIRFRRKAPTLAVNLTLLLSLTAMMTVRPNGFFMLSILIAAAILAFNAIPLVRMILQFAKKRKLRNQ